MSSASLSFIRRCPRWFPALAVVFALLAPVLPAAGQEPPPPEVKLPPKTGGPKGKGGSSGGGRTDGGSGGGAGGGSQAQASILLLVTDLACVVAVDSERVATLRAGEDRKVAVTSGQHLLTATSDNGRLQWKKVVDAKAGQTVVEINLAGGATIFSTEDFDRKMAQVWIGIDDLNVAAAYAEAALNKAWGFQNQYLSTALHTSHEYLKQQIEDLKKIVPSDTARKRMSEDVLKISTSADKYIDLMTKAITEAQKANSWMGAPSDMYSQARALKATIVFPQDALTTLKTSKAFAEPVPADRRKELGLSGDPRDFNFGAKYYHSEPNMLAVVVKGGMASDMGFKDGDRIVSVNGQNVASIWDLKLAIRANAGKKLRVVFEREGKQQDREVKAPSSLP
jgi:hypothetical protein